MSNRQDDKEFLQQISQQLDDSERELSGEVLSRLRKSRQQAINQLKSDQLDNKSHWGWRPLGTVGLVMSVVVIVISLTYIQPDSAGNIDTLSDLSLLSATEELELYEELEFYQWLEFEEHAG